jgi:3-dehydroquinate dehydratase-1
MAHVDFSLTGCRVMTVGSFGGREALETSSAAVVAQSCDVAEIRLDAISGDAAPEPSHWRHLRDMPLLFTARRASEGGNGDLDSATRAALLEAVLNDAACIDIEVASIGEMGGLLDKLRSRGLPWIASFHDFGKLPDGALLDEAVRRAADAGAAVFKLAAMLRTPADMTMLADFQLADHGIPVATMGMGPLAPVSRLLCAQCGSVLNYGYLGGTPTAPGQWDAAFLKQAIARLAPFRV